MLDMLPWLCIRKWSMFVRFLTDISRPMGKRPSWSKRHVHLEILQWMKSWMNFSLNTWLRNSDHWLELQCTWAKKGLTYSLQPKRLHLAWNNRPTGHGQSLDVWLDTWSSARNLRWKWKGCRKEQRFRKQWETQTAKVIWIVLKRFQTQTGQGDQHRQQFMWSMVWLSGQHLEVRNVFHWVALKRSGMQRLQGHVMVYFSTMWSAFCAMEMWNHLSFIRTIQQYVCCQRNLEQVGWDTYVAVYFGFRKNQMVGRSTSSKSAPTITLRISTRKHWTRTDTCAFCFCSVLSAVMNQLENWNFQEWKQKRCWNIKSEQFEKLW